MTTPRADRSKPIAACLAVLIGTAPLLAPAAQAATTGNRPVFAAVITRDNKSYLVVGHLGGSSQRVFSTEFEITAVAVSWSGNQIALSYADQNGEENIAAINADGSHFRQLTHLRLGYFEHVVWSPDDKSIYFDGTTHPTAGSKTGVARVRRVPSDGSSGASTIPGSSESAPTSARPDGGWLALNSYRPEPGYGRCAVMHVDGTSKHNVGPDNCNDALWRPHAPQLAITRVASATYSDGPTVQISVLNLKTHRYHLVPNVQGTTGGGRAIPLAWTSDGTFLYYEHRTHLGALTVYRIRPDGSGKRDLTPSIPLHRVEAIAVQPN